MRRKDRQKEADFALKLIEQTDYGVVSKGDYSLPLSLALKGNRLYGHGAKVGEKWNHFKEGDKVRVVFVKEAYVPHPIEEKSLISFYEKKEKPPIALSKIFTTNYSSAIVEGVFHEIEEEDLAKEGLKCLCEKYNNEGENLFFEEAFEMSKKITKVFFIEIKEISAKEKK